ncbi:MAG: methylmalonyl Co-A mutase-associated GTPase MeaB [Chloroflexi bacterium]|nr:methylmalonyl Co-A mutase-associated GTPase MeaB [Chloroflexota bacterium]
MDLAQRLLNGDRRAAARLITLIENDADGVELELRHIHPHTGRAHIVGVTGPPGSGKSTLVKELARAFRACGATVGIIAVDPTSPFTGGAILGDRVRMQDIGSDPGVFIRSMASRGKLGGLARATGDAVKVLDAFGCQVILVETVGAGQGEVNIARSAHTTVVVEVPGMGDEIQMIKAGILEIADVFVVNKADRSGVDRVVVELEAMLAMNGQPRAWVPPVLKTVATSGQGIPELTDALSRHLEHLQGSGELARRLEDNTLRELLEVAREEFVAELWRQLGAAEIANVTRAILDRRIDPRTAAKQLVKRFRGS